MNREAPVDDQADKLAEEAALRQVKTLRDMEAKTLVYALADRLREEKIKTVDETLGYMEAITLVKALNNTVKKEFKTESQH